MITMVEQRKNILYSHLPVLCREVVTQFDRLGEGIVVDGTLGLGGHTTALLERFPRLSVIGVEWDEVALKSAQERLHRFGERFRAIEGSYANLPELLEREGIESVDGVLVDLGVSSLQLDDASRGFSFSKSGPLDMRMSQSLETTAWDIINRWDEFELVRIFKMYGEEPSARMVAKALKDAIARGQLVNDSWQVAQCIRSVLPGGRGRIDPATRVFQALRMAVNREMDNIKTFLDHLPTVLKTGGRAVVLAFHSLEDRLVKDTFKQATIGCICPPKFPQCMCGKKPWATLPVRKAIQASEEERQSNPRSRSARLRVLEKL